MWEELPGDVAIVRDVERKTRHALVVTHQITSRRERAAVDFAADGNSVTLFRRVDEILPRLGQLSVAGAKQLAVERLPRLNELSSAHAGGANLLLERRIVRRQQPYAF